MNEFVSGRRKTYYGKGNVSVYRLHRDGNAPAGQSAVFGANVLMLIYGDAFWPSYTSGDNSSLIATDSMKNFIQRETMNFDGADLESYCYFLAVKFLTTYPQTAGAQVSATEIPYERLPGSGVSFVPSGPDAANARVEVMRDGEALRMPEARSGIRGFRLLRLNGSAFTGFVRDQYTTLPDVENRPLHMWLDLQWTYTDEKVAFSSGAVTAKARKLVRNVFDEFESGSIQQILYRIGTSILAEIPAIAQIDLEANNRTWDTIAEHASLGVYTDPRPPCGCIGLTMRR